MCIRIPLIVGLAAMLVAAGRAEEPLNAPVPLVTAAPAEASPGAQALSLAAAERAQAMGLPSAAEALWRPLLQDGGVDRGAAVLGLATALLDQGRGLEAEQALETFTGVRGAAWHLRKGLAAALQNEITTARNERDAARINELPAGDKSWHLFLQGLIATAENEHGKAVVLFSQAAEAAVSPTVRARFLLKQDQVRLRGAAPISEADVERARKTVEQYQGRRVGYEAARTYAAMLDALGRQREAVAVLQRQLVSLPAEERGELDETRLLLGLIAGAEDGAGRNALARLLERGSDRDKQRIALLLLARASTRGPALGDFRRLLDTLIGAAEPHPILEDLLLYRAQAALTAAQAAPSSELYARAEDDARTLLQKFPGTPLKAQVYGVLTESAWQQQRYRTAADNAVKARAELPPGPERAALGVLVAEAWFRARDFRAAADAYAAALREPPADVPPGKLIFQRVLAEMETDSPEKAVAVLDGLARDPAFDLVSRWQAEWNLARALQVRGKTAEAYARVTKLLGEGGPEVATLPAELRVRMGWLQARLSAGAGRPEETLRLVDALLGSLTGVGADLRNEVASSSELLRARANFALGREAAALGTLKKLRDEFPRTDAAVYSYFEEAEHYAKQDKAVEAQQLLTKLADDFPENKTYAPLALLQAALQAERRGQDANLDEALRLIEDLVQKYPDSELVFAARLKQGDLLRRRNQFPQAQQVYEDLMNKFAQRPDIVLAQLALAETHNAQSVNEPAHAESAAMLFEHVRDRMDAPVDARVEAGFSLGLLHRRRAEAEKADATKRRELARAESVWWRDVVSAFLLDPAQAAQLGDKGRYWMTRTLLELGTLYEQQEKLEQAKQAWLLVLQAKLGYGETLAKARLARFDLAEVKP